MKKLAYVLFATMLLVPVFAETPATPLGVQTNVPRVKIHKLVVIGNGVAVSTEDPSEFLVVKLALASVHVEFGEESRNLFAGIVKFDDKKFRLKEIELGNGTFTSKIYYNGTEVGYIKASSVIKGDNEVWYGEISLNDKTYNAYIVEVKRPFRPGEIVRRAAQYCKENPDDERCKIVSTSTSGQKPIENRIESYCEENPNDERCRALQKAYCLRNLDDERCRNMFRERCKEDPESDECMALKKRYMAEYCKKNPLDKECVKITREKLKDFCVENPDDERCKKPTIRTTLQRALQIKNYCIENPDDEKCVVFCHEHPALCRKIKSTKMGPIEHVKRRKIEQQKKETGD